MPYFKDSEGRLHFLESTEFSHLLPVSCVKVSDEEAIEIQKPTVDQAKASQWDAIKAERERRKAGGFKVKVGSSDKWFHSDADSRIQHLGLKDKARDILANGGSMADPIKALGQPIEWKTMDGSWAAITAQTAFDIVEAVGNLDAQLFLVAETHKATMEAVADPADYDFSGSWPKAFGEQA